MKAKLIKVNDIYRLINDNNSIIGTTDLEYQKAFSDVCFLLSTKNCEAIENGYDLDELVDEMLEKAQTPHKLISPSTFRSGIIKGFQKALEILGDKKFSEEDMVKMFFNGRESLDKALVTVQEAKSVIQSLQQTEWGVEIEMDICGDKVYAVPEPVLDENGCLILKRK